MTETIKVVSVGDLAPLRNITDCRPNVNQVWQRFREADIGIANLELALTNSTEKADKAITLKADPNISFSLADGGIDLVTFANNHACDFGTQGLMDTIEALKKANVAVVGAGENLDDALEPVIQTVKGMKIAHFGLSSTLPPGFAASENRPGIAPIRAKSRFYIDSVTLDEQPGISPWVETAVVEDDLNYVCKKIESVRDEVDLIIANVHWGIPHGWCAQFQGPLADYQRPMAHRLIDAGVDLITGHHPHVIHGIEKYKNGVIAYSLGNFLFHSMSDDHVTKLTTKYPPYNVESLEEGEAREAVIMETDISDGQLKEIKFSPVALNGKGEPEFLEGQVGLNVLNRLRKHTKELGCEIRIEGLVGYLEL